ncbi:rod shape-determining protein MreC [Mumia sp. zg.B21]|uniref:rod shape-determining protein MreC n=1 Tax=unclassified Mumia TaxID=2621872 RepID=UPI001C6ECB57|nr:MULTISPECIES: rod shape-determining protein MreC [unclassified Mumia]MBW9211178.1 rod shape-determining protein MreC [Mumia sp. zg.B21]MDD9349439.1 rod shape-determining protein MreC [Mumia sp.]
MARTRRRPDQQHRPRTVLLVLLLAAVALISVDLSGAGSPARTLAGSVLGPLESGAHRLLSPFGVDSFATRDQLRDDKAALEAENARLRGLVASSDVDRTRLAEYDALAAFATSADLETVTAHVVGIGAAQSFRRTVVLDAGTSRGVRRDMTVLGPDGLVGRVISATSRNAVVLLLVDADSVVGARLGAEHELGMLRGDGSLSGTGRLNLEVLDRSAVPKVGDPIVSWGSRDGVPYIAGVPIGRVEKVVESPRDETASVTVAPYVDFSALDTVSVVVGARKGS